jgi:hypothetical protein
MPITDLERTVAKVMQESGYPTCAGGHDMQFAGGANAGCSRDCMCSVPVHICTVCGDSDYGDNDEANEKRRACAEHRDETGRPLE